MCHRGHFFTRPPPGRDGERQREAKEEALGGRARAFIVPAESAVVPLSEYECACVGSQPLCVNRSTSGTSCMVSAVRHLIAFQNNKRLSAVHQVVSMDTRSGVEAGGRDFFLPSVHNHVRQSLLPSGGLQVVSVTTEKGFPRKLCSLTFAHTYDARYYARAHTHTADIPLPH